MGPSSRSREFCVLGWVLYARSQVFLPAVSFSESKLPPGSLCTLFLGARLPTKQSRGRQLLGPDRLLTRAVSIEEKTTRDRGTMLAKPSRPAKELCSAALPGPGCLEFHDGALRPALRGSA